MFNYEIYQLECKDENHGRVFAGYDEVVKYFGGVSKDGYRFVYGFEGFASGDTPKLEDIYYIFNVHHPEDYRGRSLSVSDVVKTPDGYFYCDSFGWKKLDWED